MADVIIKIKVDTAKLQSQRPGSIKDRSIIIMEDNQPDSYYEDPQSENYKDILHTYVDMGDVVEWSVKAQDGSPSVTINSISGEKVLDLFDSAPAKSLRSNMFSANVRTDLTEKVISLNTISIRYAGNDFTWEPNEETRKP